MTKVPTRLSDRLASLLEAGLARHGDDSMGLCYELCPLVAQAAGQPSPQVVSIVATVWARSALLGQWDTASVAVANAQALEDAQVDEAVRKVVEHLRAKRSSDLSQANGHGPGALPPGPPTGL